MFEAKLDLMYKEWNFLNEKYKGVEGVEEKFKVINEKHEAFTTPQITLKEFFEVRRCDPYFPILITLLFD